MTRDIYYYEKYEIFKIKSIWTISYVLILKLKI